MKKNIKLELPTNTGYSLRKILEIRARLLTPSKEKYGNCEVCKNKLQNDEWIHDHEYIYTQTVKVNKRVSHNNLRFVELIFRGTPVIIDE